MCVCVRARDSGTSLLLQQCRDVDVPADGLSVKAAGEQVARLVLLVPRCATHHAPVTLREHTDVPVLLLLIRQSRGCKPFNFQL